MRCARLYWIGPAKPRSQLGLFCVFHRRTVMSGCWLPYIRTIRGSMGFWSVGRTLKVDCCISQRNWSAIETGAIKNIQALIGKLFLGLPPLGKLLSASASKPVDSKVILLKKLPPDLS